MTLTLGDVLRSAGIDPSDAQAIRHAFVREHEGTGLPGIHADSTDDEVLDYTARQSASPRIFPATPARMWVVFPPRGRRPRPPLVGAREPRRGLERRRAAHLRPGRLRAPGRPEGPGLVIGWRSPRTWRLNGPTAAGYPVAEIADAHPVLFPGFDRLVLDRAQLEAVMRDHRYAAWRTALSSVAGVYLITDTRDGRQYVGKADGAESLRQRWGAYAANGHGGNVELRTLNPATFRYSILRVFDPATPTRVIDEAESHFKTALDIRRHGLNRN